MNKYFFYKNKAPILILGLVSASVLAILYQSLRSLTLDESYSWLSSVVDLNFVLDRSSNDVHPPLYYIILHVWITIFGHLELSLRFPSIIATMLLVLFLSTYPKDILNIKIINISIILLILSPNIVYYSSEARMYTFLMLFSVISIFQFYLQVEKGLERKKSISFVLTSSCLLYIHNYGVLFYLTEIIIFSLYTFIERKKNIRKIIGTLLIPMFIYLPWFLVIFKQITSRTDIGGAIKQVSIQNLFETLEFIFFENFFLTIFCMTFFFIGIIFALKENKNNRSFFLLLYIIIFFFILIPFTISYLKYPLGYSIYNYKYLLPVIPLMYILTTFSLIKTTEYLIKSFDRMNKIIRRYDVILYIAVYLLLLIIVFPSYGTIYKKNSENWRELVQEIEIRREMGDVLFFYPNWIYDPVKYYLEQFSMTLSLYSQINLTDYEDIISYLDENNRIWFITVDYILDGNLLEALRTNNYVKYERYFMQHLCLYLIE